jgi:predicted transcriptional regulator
MIEQRRPRHKFVVRLDGEDLELLKHLAQAEKLPKSQIARRALRAYARLARAKARRLSAAPICS